MPNGKAKVNQTKLPKTVNCRRICIGSLLSCIHVAYPLVKVGAQLGTVNLVTEDKAFLALNSKYQEEYEIGNVRVRVVDCVSTMSDEELEMDDYDFTVLTITEFIPTVPVDKYIFLSARDFYRQQLLDSDYKQTPIFSLFRPEFHTVKERDLAKNAKFINETHVNLKSFITFDRLMYKLITQKKFEMETPAPLIEFIAQILEGYHGTTKNDIRGFLRKAEI